MKKSLFFTFVLRRPQEGNEILTWHEDMHFYKNHISDIIP